MYYAHFGLKEPPFKITPNTEFFFSGGNRGAILDALIYAITTGEGVIKVVGEVGSGKTMLCRMLQTLLPEKVESIYLVNPSVAPEDVLYAIAFELQLKYPKNADRLQVLQVLQKYLVERHAEGKRVVIFVEEAQGMPLETLEQIRLLTNLETKHDKLLQIVLFGQPELDDNLNQTQIRQLKERITHSFNLGPLEEKEIGEYLIFRLRAAGYFGPHMFSRKAIRLLSQAAKGLVRRVNILADKSLLAAFSENVYEVTPKHVQAAIRDSEFNVEQGVWHHPKNIYYVAALLILVIAVTLPLSQYLAQPRETPAVDLAQTTLPKPEPATQRAVIDSVATLPATTIEPTPPANDPVAVTSPVNIAPAQATQQSVTPIVPVPVAAASAPATVAVAAPVQSAVTASPAPASMPQASIITDSEDVLQQRIVAAREWLEQSAASTVTMQLMGGADDDQMRDQLKSLSKQVEPDKIYVFRTRENGRPYMIVTYGSYPSWNAAAQAMQKLPKSLRVNRPKLRTAGGIQKETKLL